MKTKLTLFLLLPLLFACSNKNKNGLQFEEQNRDVPAFNADSAYQQIVAQVKNGPRNPGSTGYKQTKAMLVKKFKSYAGKKNVFVQNFEHAGYKGDTLHLANIIAAFNTSSADRIMLCAHWDTRPRADQDSVNVSKPILGADDGGSGVAMLLELARLFKKEPPPIGVDIVLFDGEDYGKENDMAYYFLGSRYWSDHPPVKNYHPRFAILLDMVGGKNAQFPKEQFSLQYAPALVKEIWNIADQKGYHRLFPDQDGGTISDDHVIINQNARIPTIDIVRHTVGPKGEVHFAPYWHTHQDSLKIIDKNTLKGVGQVLAELIYNRM